MSDQAEKSSARPRKLKATRKVTPPEPVRLEVAAPPPPQKGMLYRSVGLAVDRSELSLLPWFPRLFKAVEPAPGVRLVLEVDEESGVCRYVSLEAVRNAILEYVTITCAGRPGFCWEVRHAKDCAEHWLALAVPVAEPPAVRWQDEPGFCFNRLPWRYEVDFDGDRTPTFNELFGRISNTSALVEWIGSLFVPDSDRQQYVWLYGGSGGEGKGALVRFLKRVLGGAFAAKAAPGRDDAHWTAGLVGKRLVVFSDTNAVGFPASGLFKSLTGGDPIDINPKHKAPYCVELAAKFMLLSNARPALSSEGADMRRAIYCEFRGRPTQVDPEFEAKLWAEGGAFLSTCIHNYCTNYPTRTAIRTESDELADWVSVVEEAFEVAAERHLEVDRKAHVQPQQMQELMREERFDRKQQQEFLAWLERTHGVRKKTVRVGNETRKVYAGVRKKTAVEQKENGFW